MVVVTDSTIGFVIVWNPYFGEAGFVGVRWFFITGTVNIGPAPFPLVAHLKEQ